MTRNNCTRFDGIESFHAHESIKVGKCGKTAQKDNYRMHFHDYYELELVLEGKGLQIINGIEYRVQKGSMYLITPADIHCYVIDQDSKMTVYSMQFKSDLLQSNTSNILYSVSAPYITNLNDDDFEFYFPIFRKARNELIEKKLNYQHVISSLIVVLCTRIVRGISDCISDSNAFKKNDFRIGNIVAYIHSNFRENLTVKHIAEKFDLSPNHLGKIFTNTLNMTITQYIKRIRLASAMSLILYTNYTIEQIAYESGYKSPALFSHDFRVYYGYPPTYFRNSAMQL